MKVHKLINMLQALNEPYLDVVVQVDHDNMPGSHKFAFSTDLCCCDSDLVRTDKEDCEEDTYPGHNCVVIGI